MSLTSIQAKRTAAKTAVSELTELARGVHTAQQRSDKIEQCKTLLVDQAIDVLGTRRVDTTSKTKAFFESDPEAVCDALGSYHTALGGTFMREMFCNKVIGDVSCRSDIPVTHGPMKMVARSGLDKSLYFYGFQGSMTVNGDTTTYDTPTDIIKLDLPSRGDGYTDIELVGVLHSEEMNHTDFPESRDIIDVSQWGTECVIPYYHHLFTRCDDPEFKITAIDAPKFGGEWGTSTYQMFLYCTHFNSNINHWDVCGVTNMGAMFEYCVNFNQPLDQWDIRNVTSLDHVFSYATSFNQPINTWSTSNVISLFRSFLGATSFNQPLDQWDMSSCYTMREAFKDTTSFYQDLSMWDTPLGVNSTDFNAGGLLRLDMYPNFS